MYEFEYDEDENTWFLNTGNQPYDITLAYPYYMSYRVNAVSSDDAEYEARRGTGYRHGEGDLSKYPIFTYSGGFAPDFRDASPVHGDYEAESVGANQEVIETTKFGKVLLISGVTFAFFFGEALIHYNLGEADGGQVKWELPPFKDLFKIGGIVAGFSVLSGLTVSLLEKRIRT